MWALNQKGRQLLAQGVQRTSQDVPSALHCWSSRQTQLRPGAMAQTGNGTPLLQ